MFRDNLRFCSNNANCSLVPKNSKKQSIIFCGMAKKEQGHIENKDEIMKMMKFPK